MATERIGYVEPAREQPWDYPAEDEYEIVSVRGYPLVHYDYQINYKGKKYWYYDPRMTRVKVRDWDAFRDPGRLHYRAYCRERNKLWSRAGQTLDATSILDNFDRISGEWIEHLVHFYPAFRHFEAAMGLSLVHSTRFILGAPIQQASCYASYDRHAFSQFITRYLLLLDRRRPGVLKDGLEFWMKEPGLQPLRRMAEELLACDDPAEVLFAVTMVMGPLTDRFLVEHVARLSLENRDFVNAQLLKAMDPQNQWSLEIGKLFTRFLMEQQAESRWDYLKSWGHFTKDYRFGILFDDPTQDPEERLSNKEIVQEWLQRWTGRTVDALQGLQFVFDQAPTKHADYRQVLQDLHEWYTAITGEVGLA